MSPIEKEDLVPVLYQRANGSQVYALGFYGVESNMFYSAGRAAVHSAAPRAFSTLLSNHSSPAEALGSFKDITDLIGFLRDYKENFGVDYAFADNFQRYVSNDIVGGDVKRLRDPLDSVRVVYGGGVNVTYSTLPDKDLEQIAGTVDVYRI